MKSYYIILLLAGLALMSLSCEEDPLTIETSDEVVVEGFLYTNAPINQIKISQLIPFGLSEDDLPDISSLSVFIEWNNQSYLLTPSPGDSGYFHYDGTELQVAEGENYRIHFEYQSKEVEAVTTVPEPPAGLAIGKDEIAIEQIVFGSGTRPNFNNQNEPVDLSWNNTDNQFYYVLVENIEDNPESVFVNLPFERNFSFIAEPTSADAYLLETRTLDQYGTYRVVLYRVNQEYVDLYEQSGQDSRDLNEPLTNVENGLGVFTAVNSDTVFFEVVKP